MRHRSLTVFALSELEGDVQFIEETGMGMA
jgi:hypothetical protein